MKKDEIFLRDIGRILFGQAPPVFLLEVLLRILVIYLGALVVLRVLGKRMNGQLTIAELSVMVLLGAVIAPPAQMPERGILLGLVVLTCLSALHHGLSRLEVKSPKMEGVIQGHMSLLVKDGVLQLAEMKKTNLPLQQLYAELRNRKIYNLGQVKRLYMEACGAFSVFKETQEKTPGLPVFPAADTAIVETAEKSSDGIMACQNCGTVAKDVDNNIHCGSCDAREWTKAIV